MTRAPDGDPPAAAPAEAGRPLRRDAERNRQRILAAARALIARRGLVVSHDDIARAADVAVGTVYRRFPTKESLVEALFTERVDEIVAAGRAALNLDDPWEALATFVTGIVELQATDRGLRELNRGTGQQTAFAAYSREQITPIAVELVARAHAAGVLRPDAGQPDLFLVPIMIGAVTDATRETDPQQWRRALAVVLDGLRTQGTAPLPGRPTTPEQFDRILSAPDDDR